MSSNQSHEGVESQQPQPQPTLCSNGCGFFSNAGTGGMCSKCFRETEQAQHKLEAMAQKAQAAVARSAPVLVQEKQQEEAAAPAPTQQPSSSGAPPPTSAPCRCHVDGCRKKLGLTGFKCRCGYSFCGTHRHAESHQCSFDYKSFFALQIADANPVVQASKVQKL